MKAAAGVLGALIGLLLVGAGAYLALGRKPLSPAKNPSATPISSGPSSQNQAAPITAPLGKEEELREELGRKRLPFYRFLRENYGQLIERFSVLQDFDTLDLVVTQADESVLTGLIQHAIAPQAKQYGFRRVRFYVRNAPNSVEPFTVIAESSDDGSGRWNTFMK
jgi:hypothetical protein